MIGSDDVMRVCSARWGTKNRNCMDTELNAQTNTNGERKKKEGTFELGIESAIICVAFAMPLCI